MSGGVPLGGIGAAYDVPGMIWPQLFGANCASGSDLYGNAPLNRDLLVAARPLVHGTHGDTQRIG